MNQKALKTLEYFKIIEHLESLASSLMGKEMCHNLKPSTDIEQIRKEQTQTSDAMKRIFKKGSISFSGVKDIRASLKRLEIGSILNAGELLRICILLETTSKIKSYSKKENPDIADDSLDSLFAALEPVHPLYSRIRTCIISEEEISDEASSTLKHLRRSMKIANDKIHSQLTSMVNGSARSYLQDAVITMRNDRYCIPVKAEYKGQVPGMIHDQSSTGSTLFIEPMSVVKLNNDIKELLLKEQEEIEKILAELSELAAGYTELIKEDFAILTELDFIFAKGQLSIQYKGSEPQFNTDGIIDLKSSRHPLLNKDKVVPINIRLGSDFDLLIVTGPNTGGKTVSLKTVGLLTLMGQSGLHIPAFDGSRLAVFKEIYADIGDEQSIEQSLSTFSSHMTNIVTILNEADKDSLILFDELGAGTDPTEGAALAISILTFLHRLQIRTMATTHYSELKIFALSTPGVINASCEFDVETLRPTYRLLIGIPGKSNAFAISSKLGLPDYIIEEAKQHITTLDQSFEDVITDLESSRSIIEKERAEIKLYKTEIEALKAALTKKEEKLEERKEAILREANEKAHAILRDAKEYADQTIKNFNKYGKAAFSMKDMENDRNSLRGKLSEVEKNLTLKNKAQTKKSNKPTDFKIGDSVKVLSMNLNGTVSTLPNQKGDLFVQMGILRSQVNIKDLELIDEPVITAPTMSKTGGGKIKMSKSLTISPEINLIGKTTDEAVSLLDKYLDDAYLSHLPQVRIVHGRGTGALRSAVHNYLKKQKYVKSFRLGIFGEGETGVTIVEFK
ncbi:DNA mismatch repair protein MutS2 [Lachnotalea glycerini]|uniref:Endonuclease MutS2 n=1 Tax=Lachnotalea glycerini TaxID=1763509 RepID=A0A318EMP4_9FIRM|nr:endonuclease MutS2 [Lachnotalea glycerini]PXV91137.1 DNA mismatch repair protein MutS2 [Lachnotalea glycerini]